MNTTSLEKIKEANRAAGLHFFEESTMRFFDSKLHGRAFEGRGGVFFVTSEQFRGLGMCPDGPRLYSIRQALPDGKVDTVGKFQQFRDLAPAEKAAMACAESGVPEWVAAGEDEAPTEEVAHG